MDLDLEDLDLQAENDHSELNTQTEHLAGRSCLRNLESGGQGVL